MIRVLIAISGRTDGHNLEVVGSVHKMNPVIKEQLVRQEYAEYVPEPESEPEPVIETATVAPPENAAKRTSKPQARRKA